MTIEDIHYQHELTEVILRLTQEGLRNFQAILEKCEGAYPTVVRSIILELTEKKLIPEVDLCVNEKDSFPDFNYAAEGIPHPADYDWRFTHASLNTIVNHSKNRFQAGSKIGLFGTSTLFEPLTREGFDTSLFNNSKHIVSSLRKKTGSSKIFEHDLFIPLDIRVNDFDVIFADPPWYPEFYCAFLSRASELMKNNGRLFLAMFPRLTRPSAEEERSKIKDMAFLMGFELEDESNGYFHYVTPTFEANALAEEELPIHTSWRSGDLWVFKKTKSSAPILDCQKTESYETWEDFVVRANTRVKVRKREESDVHIFDYQPVDDTKVLRTISRRYPNRQKIDLWTSDNVAFSITRISVIVKALKMMEQQVPVNEIMINLKKEFADVEGLEKVEKLLAEL